MRWLLPALVLLTGCAHGPLLHLTRRAQAQYTLRTAAENEADPAARLAFLNKWKAGFPKTKFLDERQQMSLMAYAQLNQAREGFDKAQEILKIHPVDFHALYATVSLLTQINPRPRQRI